MSRVGWSIVLISFHKWEGNSLRSLNKIFKKQRIFVTIKRECETSFEIYKNNWTWKCVMNFHASEKSLILLLSSVVCYFTKKKKKKKKQNKDTEVNFIKMLEKLTNFEQAGLVVCSGRLLTGINSNNGQLNDAQRRQFFKLVDPFSNYETSFNSNLRINWWEDEGALCFVPHEPRIDSCCIETCLMTDAWDTPEINWSKPLRKVLDGSAPRVIAPLCPSKHFKDYGIFATNNL